ncbi:allantoate amidohydrolase [Marinactinospora thermotolerans]|uniref:N-carbamoyl-L-amino-acid hydrolase n=1 Tax=Marinactinospora thermotolerans DSM 45154 TaxID=1122192 RepID=A0A1T4S2G2_9ACTN|nr:allantoate amidohydrolase [Marinactinospora thermotolerans]SKA22362.1 N-carbamoyl-L-amino-acid hydrolase [Marinactinospora thermotolerans DSM 45154]
MSTTFDELWSGLHPIGRNRAGGGYRRFSWTPADAEARAWFTAEARARGLRVETDRNGNLWAWWGEPAPGAVVTGSHLDSVPDGGPFDGPLGVAGALAAVDLLKERGFTPSRPIAVTVFVEEEGARFGVPCLGSRLLTGAIAPERARGLADADGVTWASAAARAGVDPERIGADPERLALIGTFVELHIEQGRALAGLDAPVGVAGAVWPHGRWRLDFTGQADHAGTTRLADRNDPMLPFAETVLAARSGAEAYDAVATIGRVQVTPNGTNAIPSRVRAWLDARAPEDVTLRALVEHVNEVARRSSVQHGVALASYQESLTPIVKFQTDLRDRVAAIVGGARPAPVLATGAGHDAGVLAAAVPTAMLFVRNPTGVSHAPEESAERADVHAGVVALADVLADLAGTG